MTTSEPRPMRIKEIAPSDVDPATVLATFECDVCRYETEFVRINSGAVTEPCRWPCPECAKRKG